MNAICIDILIQNKIGIPTAIPKVDSSCKLQNRLVIAANMCASLLMCIHL